MPQSEFSFDIVSKPERSSSARAGTINTPHGTIQTPAFIPVGTKATVKSVMPESMQELGSQALLANAYHLYLQPGADIVDAAGGLGKFMKGAGFKKVLAMETDTVQSDDVIAENKTRLAHVDDDGVTFKSHLDGTMHRFTPEFSMQVQHQLGADIIFAFDELTTLMNTRDYQVMSLERTRLWAIRCIAEHKNLTTSRANKPYQALFGVIQGAQYEDLRRKAASDLGAMDFDGYGIGGALDKHELGTIVSWVTEELPLTRPRHLLGIGEPEDLFVGVEAGIDTFDCVSASRVARNAAVYNNYGRFNITNAKYRKSFEPLVKDCECYTCTHYTQAYLHHLVHAKELLASTLLTIHNEHFIVGLVAKMRQTLIDGNFQEFKTEFLGQYQRPGLSKG
ncbi:MAG: tRNA guanosine(34) transglycosylase Tgt [Actinobacteria bacterium]|nr:tRNA guanosine(34) transglycosylase Tgt [Actinomycetota bacterium]